jgi:hypothetical protein
MARAGERVLVVRDASFMRSPPRMRANRFAVVDDRMAMSSPSRTAEP